MYVGEALYIIDLRATFAWRFYIRSLLLFCFVTNLSVFYHDFLPNLCKFIVFQCSCSSAGIQPKATTSRPYHRPTALSSSTQFKYHPPPSSVLRERERERQPVFYPGSYNTHVDQGRPSIVRDHLAPSHFANRPPKSVGKSLCALALR